MTDKEIAQACKEYAPKFKAKYLDYFKFPDTYGIAPIPTIQEVLNAIYGKKKQPDHRKLRDRIGGRLSVSDMCKVRLLQQLTRCTHQDIINAAVPRYVEESLSQLEAEVKCANITT